MTKELELLDRLRNKAMSIQHTDTESLLDVVTETIEFMMQHVQFEPETSLAEEHNANVNSEILHDMQIDMQAFDQFVYDHKLYVKINKKGNYTYAWFSEVVLWINKKCYVTDEYGIGSNEEEATADLARRISGMVIVENYMNMKRREIKVPIFILDKKPGVGLVAKPSFMLDTEPVVDIELKNKIQDCTAMEFEYGVEEYQLQNYVGTNVYQWFKRNLSDTKWIAHGPLIALVEKHKPKFNSGGEVKKRPMNDTTSGEPIR